MSTQTDLFGGDPSPSPAAPPPEGTTTGAAPTTPPPAAPEGFKLPENWREQLPEELRNEPSLGAFQDLPSLAKSLVHAQKQIGKDKIVIPDKHATEEDWQKVFQKLGNPEKFEDYKLGDLPKDVDMDPTFIEKFTKRAHALGVNPKQAKALLEGYIGDFKENLGAVETTTKAKIDEGFANLGKEWGEAYNKNVQGAKVMIADYADDADMAYIKEKGLNTDPGFIRLMGKMGAALKEDAIKGGLGRQDSDAMTPESAQEEMKRITTDMKHPYYDKNHPGHKDAVAEVTRLSKYAYPGPKK